MSNSFEILNFLHFSFFTQAFSLLLLAYSCYYVDIDDAIVLSVRRWILCHGRFHFARMGMQDRQIYNVSFCFHFLCAIPKQKFFNFTFDTSVDIYILLLFRWLCEILRGFTRQRINMSRNFRRCFLLASTIFFSISFLGLLILSLYISDWLIKFARFLGEFSQIIAVLCINLITIGTALSFLYCAWRSFRQFMIETKKLDRVSSDKDSPKKITQTDGDSAIIASGKGGEQ